VDENVDRAELVDRALHRLVHLRTIRDVALDGGRAAAQVAGFLRGLLGVDEALRTRRLGDRAVALGVLARVRLQLDVYDDDVGARSTHGQRIRAVDTDPPSCE